MPYEDINSVTLTGEVDDGPWYQTDGDKEYAAFSLSYLFRHRNGDSFEMLDGWVRCRYYNVNGFVRDRLVRGCRVVVQGKLFEDEDGLYLHCAYVRME